MARYRVNSGASSSATTEDDESEYPRLPTLPTRGIEFYHFTRHAGLLDAVMGDDEEVETGRTRARTMRVLHVGESEEEEEEEEDDDDHEEVGSDSDSNGSEDEVEEATDLSDPDTSDALYPRQKVMEFGTVAFYFEGLDGPVRIKQDIMSGCGGKTWETANMMCQYFASVYSQNKQAFRNTRIIELGAGTGIVSIVLGMMGARVTCTDQRILLPLMKENVKLNRLEALIHCIELKWYVHPSRAFRPFNDARGESLHPQITPPYDMIVTSDCIYMESSYKSLIQSLSDLAGHRTRIIVGYKQRKYAMERSFFSAAGKRFTIESVRYARPRLGRRRGQAPWLSLPH